MNTQHDLMRELIALATELAPKLNLDLCFTGRDTLYETRVAVPNSQSVTIQFVVGLTQIKAVRIQTFWGSAPIKFDLKFAGEARVLKKALQKAFKGRETQREDQRKAKADEAALEALQKAVDALKDLRF